MPYQLGLTLGMNRRPEGEETPFGELEVLVSDGMLAARGGRAIEIELADASLVEVLALSTSVGCSTGASITGKGGPWEPSDGE